MAQHDYVIDNQSFPATRTDLNNVLQAIVSNNSGTSAPSTTFANQIWYDSNANILYIRNEDNDANIPLMQFDQSADVASTLATVIDILDASGTNQAGTALTIRGGAGTGTGTGGSIILQVADGGSSGSSVNSHATAIEIKDDGTVEVSGDLSITDKIIHTGDTNTAIRFPAADTVTIETGGSEVVRVDSSQRVQVGKTTNVIGTAGHNIASDGFVSHTRDGNYAMGLNRLSSDGDMLQFFKDGSVAGKIGTVSGALYIGSLTGNDSFLAFNSDAIIPSTSAGANRDDVIDLGNSSSRFDDIFATNGTIQTSDQNEKQDASSLTSAEITAAKAISKLFKTFKWKSKVASKGDAARTHAGVVAQEVQSAMTDAGLDATKYAFFCSDTWWEAQTDVPAIEADEDNGVKAQDAYTRTDTYKTADEAPEGATERTRLGIRYPELLAFIGAATEQRLADIETRLTALEG